MWCIELVVGRGKVQWEHETRDEQGSELLLSRSAIFEQGNVVLEVEKKELTAPHMVARGTRLDVVGAAVRPCSPLA